MRQGHVEVQVPAHDTAEVPGPGRPAWAAAGFRAGIPGVDHGHIDLVVGQKRSPLERLAEDELSVRPDLHVGKRRAPPEIASIEQRAAGQPGVVVVDVPIEPGAAAGRLMKQQAGQTADLRAVAQKRLHLAADAVGGHPVVIVPMEDEIAAAGLDALVALSRVRWPGRR